MSAQKSCNLNLRALRYPQESRNTHNLNNHLSELKMAKAKNVTPPIGIIDYVDHVPTAAEQREIEEGIRQDFVDTYLESNEAAFYKLFPLAKSRAIKKIQQEDIKNLKDRFYSMAESIIQDRDGYRAHRFESTKGNRAAQRGERLSVEKIGLVFDQIEDFLNDIRLITNHSSFAYNDMNICSVETTAEDLVDMILLGTSIQIHHHFGIDQKLSADGHPYFVHAREDFYKRLHNNHGEISAKIHARAVADFQKRPPARLRRADHLQPKLDLVRKFGYPRRWSFSFPAA